MGYVKMAGNNITCINIGEFRGQYFGRPLKQRVPAITRMSLIPFPLRTLMNPNQDNKFTLN